MTHKIDAWRKTYLSHSQHYSNFIDKGTPVNLFKDYCTSYPSYIHMIKLGFGTAMLYRRQLLAAKIDIAHEQNLSISPGGTLFEVMQAKNMTKEYIAWVKDVGFNAIELSNGVYDFDIDTMLKALEHCLEAGLDTYIEVGKKDIQQDLQLTNDKRIQQATTYLKAGAKKVILEARDSGNLGIFDQHGKVIDEKLEEIVAAIDYRQLIFEAPQKDQQAYLINHIATDIHLGNLAFEETLAVAALRNRLRGDTIMISGEDHD